MAPHTPTMQHISQLSASLFQSLLDYGSSRCRAASIALLVLEKNLEPAQLELFQTTLENELTWSTYLFGIGAFLFPHSHLEPPLALRNLSQLFAQGQLYDFEAMSKAVLLSSSPPDRLLSHYEHNWWSDFPKNAPPSGVVTQRDIFDAWQRQAQDLPPSSLPITRDGLPIDALLQQENDTLLQTAESALVDVEEQISVITAKRAKLSEALAEIDAMQGSSSI